MMKRLLTSAVLALALSIATPILRGQTYQSQITNPIVRYKMAARLDPAAKTVKGHYTLTWWNHTSEPVSDLYFHLYLNAFKNTGSTFMREAGLSRRHRLVEEWNTQPEQEKWGWVDVNKIQIAGGPDLTASRAFVHPDDDNAADQTVMRVQLPQPVAPLGTLELSVDFTSRLPRGLARTGYVGDYFFVAQWFPKIGVYESAAERNRKAGKPDAFAQGAWNCHQFHANTEFFADFGVYDVELTVPAGYVIGATGVLRGDKRNSDGTITYNFFQEDVHDFAWTASPRFLKLTRKFDWGKEVRADELVTWSKLLELPAQELALSDVNVTLLLQPDHRGLADRYFRAAFNAIKYYGLWYGHYPYDTLTVVDPARNSETGGMEYPTFITGGVTFWPGSRSGNPEGVTVHEFGHQFWYGLVANNEFENAWLDEGLNTYSTGKVLETAYPPECTYRRFFGVPVRLHSWFQVRVPPFPFAGVGRIPLGGYLACDGVIQRTERRPSYLREGKDDAILRNGWEYMDGASYAVNSYDRVALTLRTLESYLGEGVMLRAMRTFQLRWRYRHPIPRDFFDTVNEVSGRDMNWFFDQFFRGSNLADYAVAEITNDPLEGKTGIYDEDGKKVPYLEKGAEEAFEKSPRKKYRSTVLVRRLGEAAAPVDVLVHFEDGETAREQWDGRYRWARFVYERAAKVASAEVDPERKLALDANFTNNSRTDKKDNRAAAKWYVRWIFWLENLFLAAGFFA